MKKMKLILNESLISNKDSDIIEDTTIAKKPDYQIIDITVIPDETYYPTIQSILIDLDESNKLKESEDSKLDINILSETVNQKTGYSNSLFEFESSKHTITLSLVLQETDRRGIYKVEAYTTRGIKVFESNTYRPKYVVESYLNSLANEYLIDKPLKEGETFAYNSLKEMLKAKGKKLVHYTNPKNEIGKDTKTQSVFNFSNENGGCPDSFKYYNDYVVVDDIKESVRVYDDEKDYSSELSETYNVVADFINDEFKNRNKNYIEYSGGMDRVDSGKVFMGITQALYNSGYYVSKDRVKHYADIGNNSAYEIFKDTECIGFLNVNSGLYGDAYVYLEELNGNKYGGSWELRPADDWHIKKDRVVIYKEAEDLIKDDVKEDLGIEPGSDEEATLDEIYEEPEKPYEGLVDDYKSEDPAPNSDPDDYSVEEFMTALRLADEVYDLNIDYSKWNDASQEERFELVKPEISRFLAKHKNEFDKSPKLFDLLQYDLIDANFHTEAKVLKDLYRGGK